MNYFVSRASLLLALCSPALATDIVVTPGNSIQDAITAAVDGDRVLVQAGTYFERINFLGKSIQVIGVAGPAATTIDAQQTGSVVSFGFSADEHRRLAGFTITGGASGFTGGGGIYLADGARPTIEDCVITGNSGKYGAGVHGSPVMLRCTVSFNIGSQTFGGGIWGAPEMTDCVIDTNTVSGGSGGGLFVANGVAVLRNCRIQGNRAIFGDGRGGGLHVDSTADAILERCLILDNLGNAGVFGAYGAGLFVEAPGTYLRRCTLVDNVLFSGTAELGGAVYGPAVLRSSIVRGNIGTQLDGGATAQWCDVEGGFPGAGNFDLDPLFVDAPNDDFHLLAGSPCIDAGDPTAEVDANGSTVDAGAFSFDLIGPETFCIAAPNSVGAGAPISWSGSPSLAAANLELSVSGAPVGQFGVFYYGGKLTQVPFGDGFRCVTTSGTGVHRFAPAVQVDASGAASYLIDYNAPPANGGPGAITPGSSWYFQFWYRDPGGPLGQGFNLSDALWVHFVM